MDNALVTNLKQTLKGVFDMTLKNAVKVFTVAAVLALSMALLAGCSSNSKSDGYKLVNEGKLTVASSLDFPPFESLDGDTPTGLSIAVAQEIAKRLNLECEIKNTKFDTIVPAINAGGQFDMGISSITIDPERAKQVDFSDAYYIADQSVVVMKGKYTSTEELKGKKVGGQSGTTGFAYAQEHITDQAIPYDEATACFAALQSGNVEAVAIDLPVSKAMIAKAYPDCEIIEEIATGEEYGIAINKDNTALTEAINKALKEMKEDGTLEKIQQQYLG